MDSGDHSCTPITITLSRSQRLWLRRSPPPTDDTSSVVFLALAVVSYSALPGAGRSSECR